MEQLSSGHSVAEIKTATRLLALSPNEIKKLLTRHLSKEFIAEALPVLDSKEQIIEALNLAFEEPDKIKYYMLRQFVFQRRTDLYDNGSKQQPAELSGARKQLIANALKLIIDNQVETTPCFLKTSEFILLGEFAWLDRIFLANQRSRRKQFAFEVMLKMIHLGTFAEVKEISEGLLFEKALELIAQQSSKSLAPSAEVVEVQPLLQLENIFFRTHPFRFDFWLNFLWKLQLDPRTTTMEGLKDAIVKETAFIHYSRAAKAFIGAALLPGAFLGISIALQLVPGVIIYGIVLTLVLAFAITELVQGVITHNSPLGLPSSLSMSLKIEEDLKTINFQRIHLKVDRDRTYTFSVSNNTVGDYIQGIKAAVEGSFPQAPTPSL